MGIFLKKIEVVLTVIILVAIGLYITGHFDSAPTSQKQKNAAQEQLAQAETHEERMEIIRSSGDVGLMQEMAGQEARKMLQSGDLETFEAELNKASNISEVLGQNF